MLLKQLKRPDALEKVETPKISLQDHIEGWKKQKENTGCETSGLNFAHLKAACKHPNISVFDWQMRKLPMEIGFAPKLYRETTDCQILKKENVDSLEKMRTIMMFNSEFNNNNK